MNAQRTLTKRLGIEGIGVKGAVRKPTTKKSLAVGYVRPAIRKRLPHKNCCPAPLPTVWWAFLLASAVGSTWVITPASSAAVPTVSPRPASPYKKDVKGD